MTSLLGIVLTAAMSGLLSHCAPSVGTKTMAGIIQYESGWNRFAIGDNDAHHSYFPKTLQDASAIASSLLRQGHNIDAGYGQVNSENWKIYGLDAVSVFDPCSNVRVGAAIISADYASASRYNWVGRKIVTRNDRYYQEQYALIHALSSYNSGGFWASMNYAGNVYQTAMNVHYQNTIDPTGFTKPSDALPPAGTPFSQAFEPSFGDH